jgi:antitoxin ParD1/3/4
VAGPFNALHLLEQQENQTTALRDTVEAGEKSEESELSLQDIAAEQKCINCLSWFWKI